MTTSEDILKNATFCGSEKGLDKRLLPWMGAVVKFLPSDKGVLLRQEVDIAVASRGSTSLSWMGGSRKIPPSLTTGVLLG
jgi:hypothetical protein